MKRTLWILLLLVGVAGAFFVPKVLKRLRVEAPAYEAPGQIVQLEQGWSDEQRRQFHHIAQGTRLVPYKWLLALEQPCLSPFGCELLARQDYLGRFGFLASPADPVLNPDALPVGFAKQDDFSDPETGKVYPVAGLTCAACHTGELRFNNYAVRVEGAPAMIQVTTFQKAVGIALILTEYLPMRYRRFQERVLGPDATDAAKAELRTEYERFLAKAKAEVATTERDHIYPNDAGFARTDALTRIGNQVFGADMGIEGNYAVANAPVRFPQVWDASWFTWVQYNSSIGDPLVRNIGEALGVRALAQLSGPKALDYASSVNMPGLKKIEDLLAGSAPFTGLRSPKWPEVFPKIDEAKAKRGEELYRKNCQACHLPPQAELQADLASEKPTFWVSNSTGKRFLNLRDLPIAFVGTDPRQAEDFMKRTADSAALGKGRVSAAAGLQLVTEGIRDQYFAKANLTPEQKLEWRGFRDDTWPSVQSQAVYKARPLNGIWAAAPYLHNGSVPTLYELLASKEQRPARKFWLGTKQFDATRVGYVEGKVEGGFELDPAVPGNSNQGHYFQDGPRGNGVVGPALTDDDRWALIEFLKTL